MSDIRKTFTLGDTIPENLISAAEQAIDSGVNEYATTSSDEIPTNRACARWAIEGFLRALAEDDG